MERISGLVLVLLLHAAVLWGLWQHRLLPEPQHAVTLFVNFIDPVVTAPKEIPVPPPPKLRKMPVTKPPPPIIAALPALTPTETIAPTAPPVPRIAALPVPPTPPKLQGPVHLASELSAACPQRMPPGYPLASRRLGEEGVVVLRVELDELGAVSAAHVASGSGFLRLDQAALAAVQAWRCTPAQRDGRPVRAIAMQPFNFILQGN